ncbi:Uncharacterised protein [Yersinia frederiksenii]|uniref:hypothetical protein n=1 Tax=Yersinia enterocolitica TaxID=630 RepID=UPI0005DCB656|nr:hypothetical protein [Yersinia enterocolitica]CNG99487.1 Uncharacterised protein [Yersinia enterocolitica]CNK74259.1 Uncharacterised protein [Yersinia frederiksenii]
MKSFLDEYRKVANDTSGVIALAIIQSLVVVASARKFDISGDRWHSVLFWVFLLISTAGLLMSACCVGKSILDSKDMNMLRKTAMLILFEIVFVGVIISSAIAIKSL